MEYSIEGKLAQYVRIRLQPGDSCWASRGALISYDPGIQWSLKVPGGLGGAARRALSGEGVALTQITAVEKDQGGVLSANQPGKIIDWDLKEGPVLTTRGSFVAAFGPGIQIDVTIAKRAGAAFFGGAGLFLQKISGQGTVLIHGAGDFLDKSLRPEETIRVSTGNLAAFADGVDYNIESIRGLRRIFFGGEGLFVTTLRGPGRVLLQSLKRATRTERRSSGS